MAHAARTSSEKALIAVIQEAWIEVYRHPYFCGIRQVALAEIAKDVWRDLLAVQG